MSRPVKLLFLLIGLATLHGPPGGTEASPLRAVRQEVRSVEVAGVAELHAVGSVLLASQPAKEAFAELARRGTTTVIDVRVPGENEDFVEPATVRGAGLRYVNAGFATVLGLNDRVYALVRHVLLSEDTGTILVHGASADRAAAVWLVARVLDQGVEWEAALSEARACGLRTESYAERAKEYVLAAPRWAELKAEIRARFPLVEQMSVTALAAERPAEREAPLLLDVRTVAEFELSHLAGARRAASRKEALAQLRGVSRDAEVVLYCSVGYRSSALAAALADAGFTNVRNLEGSIFEWANAGYPLYRGSQPARSVHPYDAHWGQLLRRALRAELDER